MAPWEVLLAGSVNLGLNENYYCIHNHKQLNYNLNTKANWNCTTKLYTPQRVICLGLPKYCIKMIWFSIFFGIERIG